MFGVLTEYETRHAAKRREIAAATDQTWRTSIGDRWREFVIWQLDRRRARFERFAAMSADEAGQGVDVARLHEYARQHLAAPVAASTAAIDPVYCEATLRLLNEATKGHWRDV